MSKAYTHLITRAIYALFCFFFLSSIYAQPAGFLDQEHVGGFNQAVGMTFDANGRMYVWEKAGKIWVVENGTRLPNPLLDISEEVGGWRDFGLLGVALDPDFLSNGRIYCLYIVDFHHLQNFGTPSYNPSTNKYFDATIGRITRYTATAASNFTAVDYNSRKVLFGTDATNGFPNLHQSHGTGSLVFGTDGTLLASLGDGASYSSVDQGSASETYYQNAINRGIITNAENIGAYRVQLLDNYAGKILRIDPETGAGIPSNPYYDAGNPNSRASKVWARGLRNPCRFSKKPETGSHDPADGDPGTFYIGDVGWGNREELNVLENAGQNFGWPKYEGMTHQPGYNNNSYAPSSHTRPKVDWRGGTARVYKNGQIYNVGSSQMPGPNFTGNCSMGGIWYNGDDFPATYKNTYFHADYGGDWILNFGFDDNNDPTFVRSFKTGANAIVFVATSPVDGGIYYIGGAAGNSNNITNAVRKISYAGGSFPPIAVAKSDVLYGNSPLEVQFNGSQSYDPDNGPLTYNWDFGDGSSSSSVNPTHEFTSSGNAPITYTVTLTVTDLENLSSQKTLKVSLNNTPPNILSTSIDNTNFFSSTNGNTLNLNANISDAEHSNNSLSYQWITELHHNDHFHPEAPDTNPSTSTVLSPIGCDGSTYFYRVKLNVTDPGGLTTSFQKDIFPDCSGNPQSINFPALSDKLVTDVPFNISATASSGLPVIFHIFEGPATISGNSIRLTGQPGKVVVRAIQSGDGIYAPAIPVEQSFEVKVLAGSCSGTGSISREVWTGLSQSVEISTIPLNTNPNIEDEISIFEIPVNVLERYGTRVRGYICPPVSGDYTFWITSDDNGELWLSTDQTEGNKSLIASVPGWSSSREWGKYPEQKSATISLIQGNRYYVEALMRENGGGDNLAVGWELPNGALQRPIPGLYLIPWDGGQQAQTITFPNITDKLTTDNPFDLNAAASSGLSVSYAIVSGPASVSGNTITLNGQEGTVVVSATQAGDNSYLPASPVERSFVVTTPPLLSQTISFPTIADRLTSDGPFSLNATASSGLSVSYTIVSGPASVSGNTITLDGQEGTVVVSATQAGNSSYSAASPVERSFAVTAPPLLSQTISFPAIADRLTSDGPFSLNATASSGLSISYNIVSGPASVSGNTITLNGQEGTVVVQARQAGDASYEAAAPVDRSFEVTAPIIVSCNGTGSISREIWTGLPFNSNISSIPLNTAPDEEGTLNVFNIPEDFADGYGTRVSGYVCPPISGNYIFWITSDDNGELYLSTDDDPANKVLIAEVPGWADYLEWDKYAEQQSISISLTAGNRYYIEALMKENRGGDHLTVGWQLPNGDLQRPITGDRLLPRSNTRSDQTISFPALSDRLTTDADFEVIATASSGLAVNLEILSGPATLSGNVLSLDGSEGTVIIQASQPGNGDYNAAPSIERSFVVSAPSNGGCNTTSNLAENKPSSQSSTQQGADPERANDGNTNGDFWNGRSVTQTNWQSQPWWEVDLGQVADIESINVWNRADINDQFLDDYYLLISSTPFTSTDLNTTLNQPGVIILEQNQKADRPSTIAVNRDGRYVRIQLQGTAFLSLAEVEVIGCFSGSGPTPEDQSISFAALPDRLTTDADFTLNASASSGLPVDFSILSGPASISGNTLSLDGQPGTVTVRASQAGNANFNPAPAIEQSFTVNLPSGGGDCNSPDNVALNKPARQSSTQQGADPERANDGNTNGNFWVERSVSQTAWQSQPWWEVDLENLYTIESIRIWNREDGNEIFLKNYQILVSNEPFESEDLNASINQSGVSSYAQSAQAERPTVLNINRDARYVRIQLEGTAFLSIAEIEVMGCPANTNPIDQTISFDPIPDQLTTNAPFELQASASSGLPVEFSIVRGLATISGNTLTLFGDETSVEVMASQPGNAFYNAAPTVIQSFEVTAPSGPAGVIIRQPTDGAVIQGSTVQVEYEATGNWAAADVDHLHLVLDGNTVASITNYSGSYPLVFVDPGNHTLTAVLYDSNDEPLSNPEASYTINFTTEEEPLPLNKIDLEVTLNADKATLPIWQFVVFTVELENKGDITASNIAVSVPIPDGFAYAEMSTSKGEYTPWDQQWKIPTLAAGETESIDLTLFALQDDESVDFFVQVLGVEEEDLDSAPGNNSNRIPEEDDEALVTIEAFSGSSNRAKEGHWFEVYRNGMTVDLHWLTQLEPIVEEFIIEHWTDGSDYQPLKSRAPQLSPSDVTYYTDVHLDPKAGINFYRLKQVLKDGTIVQSPVRQILFEPTVEDFVLFPNPAEDYVELQLRPIVGKEVQIMIYDHLGREQYQEYIPEVQMAPHRINLEAFIEGHYMVWIYTKDRRSVAKRLVIGKR